MGIVKVTNTGFIVLFNIYIINTMIADHRIKWLLSI